MGLEEEIEQLLEVERSSRRSEFREKALWSDPEIYEQAAANPEAFWSAQAKELLDWDAEPTEA